MDGEATTTKRRVAVVTGAGRGIGAAIARRLAADGFAVALWDVDPTAAGAIAESLTDSVAIAADITDRGSVGEALHRTIDAIGPVDTFVNNAGIDVIGPFLSSHEDDWDRIIAVNLVGLFNCCKAILPCTHRARRRDDHQPRFRCGARRIQRRSGVLGHQGRRDRLHQDPGP